MKFSLYISIVSMFLVSCSSMNKIVLLDKDLDKDTKITTANYPKHQLQEGDILHVKIIGIQEESFDIFNVENNANNSQTTSANLFLNGFTIDSKGDIEIPTLGKIPIEGLTVEEAKSKIQTRANDFLINSTVIVKHINFEITVLGEVNRPGTYTVYKDNITILEALGLSGDLSDYANRKKIKLIRDNKILYIDLTEIETLYSQNFVLKSDDVIYVEPLRNVRLRSSNAQIYISAISSIALIANIVFSILNP
ncbi:MAG: polysaccharide biosynthesis/export family protein [Flavobacteriales bacterium]|jgi:polysaccharide biosynthesis/export protein|nr:polysaccharide transporter [Flavobacteriales bacterium]MDG1917580.1 polysaccharide biosynthesis/export family protein [Flavobacteriales bacterium]